MSDMYDHIGGPYCTLCDAQHEPCEDEYACLDEVALAPLALAEYIRPTAPPSGAEIARRRRVARRAKAKR